MKNDSRPSVEFRNDSRRRFFFPISACWVTQGAKLTRHRGQNRVDLPATVTKRRAMSIVVLSVVLALSLPMTSALKTEDADSQFDRTIESSRIHSLSSSTLVSHPLIYIDGNASFASQASSEGWSGNGSAGNPYVIDGYDIDGTGWWGSIYIRNTDVYFVISNCYVYGGNCGIHLENVTNGLVTYNNCSDTTQWGGVLLDNSRNNTVSNNTCLNNIEGVWAYASGSNVVRENNCSANRYAGIRLRFAINNMISNNTCWSNGRGIDVDSSSSNAIIGNTCSSNYYGMYVYSSGANTFINNAMMRDGVFIDGDIQTFVAQSIDGTNTVNGKPVFYCKDTIGGDVPPDVGQVILANCSDMIVHDQDLTRTSVGIELGFCSDISLLRNNCSSNIYGAWLKCSAGLVVDNNFSSNMNEGMILLYTSSCSIQGNWFVGNLRPGLWVSNESAPNRIWNNVFIRNNGAGDIYDPARAQASDDGPGRYWNATGCGNYWSDWQSPDANHDGIVDLPYNVTGMGYAEDYYPLTTPPLAGPNLTITAPEDDSIVSNPVVTVAGNTDPGVSLSVNGIIVLVSNDGSYSLQIALLEGLNEIRATATDSGGNSTTDMVHVTYVNPVYALMDELNETLARLNATENSLYNTLSTLTYIWTQLNDTANRAMALQNQLDALNEQLNATLSDLNLTEGNVTQLQMEIASLTDHINAVSAEYNSTLTTLAMLRDELNTTNAALNAIQSALTNTQTQLSETQAALNNTWNTLDDTKTELNAAHADLNSTRSDLNTTQNNLSSARSDISSLKNLALVLEVVVSALAIMTAGLWVVFLNLRRGTGKTQV